jgi:hypothetical protein
MKQVKRLFAVGFIILLWGGAVFMVGNGSENLRKLHERLGGDGEGPCQYGDMFIYTIPGRGPVTVKISRYGS